MAGDPKSQFSASILRATDLLHLYCARFAEKFLAYDDDVLTDSRAPIHVHAGRSPGSFGGGRLDPGYRRRWFTRMGERRQNRP